MSHGTAPPRGPADRQTGGHGLSGVSKLNPNAPS